MGGIKGRSALSPRPTMLTEPINQQQLRRRRRRLHRILPVLLLLLQLITLLITPINASSYLGPTHCTPPPTSLTDAISANAHDRIHDKYNGIGYSTYNHLLFDLVALTSDYKNGLLHTTIDNDTRLTFILCPGSIIDLDTGTLPLGYIPLEIPNVILQCGKKGIRSMTSDDSDACIIRGGGKRTTGSSTTSLASSSTTTTNGGMGSSWNVHPEHSYKPSIEGIIGGGHDSIAQIYVYGDTAYEVTLKGITFDNSITEDEMKLYDEYVEAGYVVDEEEEDVNVSFGGTSSSSSTIPPPPSDNGATTFDLGSTEVEDNVVSIVFPNENEEESSVNLNNNVDDTYQSDVPPPPPTKRRLQDVVSSSSSSAGPKPAHRFASIAVRGKGYGDDAGPQLISIEDCKFINHRGYAILVSPGIQMPILPSAPEYNFTPPTGSSGTGMEEEEEEGNQAARMSVVNLQSSGQLYGDRESEETTDSSIVVEGGNGRRLLQRLKQRWLNLLDDGWKYISPNGSVTYYDNRDDVKKNYLDGRRVQISGTEFVNNIVSSDVVAGLVTSAYSLTITNCLFESNIAKSMVFVHNEDALIDDTVFIENTVEVSTVLMTSPKSKETTTTTTTTTAATTTSNIESIVMPTHIVERSCFLKSNVGMSNVLVTDVDSARFGQRDNHASNTKFTWSSTCEGGAAESNGNDCLESGGDGKCDGICVRFTSEECLASRVAGGGGYEQYSSSNGGEYGFGRVWAFGGAFLFVMWHSSS